MVSDGQLQDSGNIAVQVYPVSTVNTAPIVNAGEDDRSLTLPAVKVIKGEITDDQFPNTKLTYKWEVVGSSGNLSIDDPAALETTVHIPAESCQFTLRLTVSDGEFTVMDETKLIDSIRDVDGDGAPDIEEIEDLKTDLNNFDTDGDGIPDGYEASNGLDPLSKVDRDLDLDGDLLSNFNEFVHSTDAIYFDTDGDTMLDGWEVKNGLDPRVDDASLDKDGDGVSNLDEYKANSNPADHVNTASSNAVEEVLLNDGSDTSSQDRINGTASDTAVEQAGSKGLSSTLRPLTTPASSGGCLLR